jgi:lipopolysaccharide transport system ATP-binding protein
LESKYVLRMDRVSKKFRKGEFYDSFRDALPALVRKLAGRGKQVSPSDRDFWALQEISLSVAPGEVVGIIGHNGAGKSTILKLLCGLLKPTTGTIEVKGSLSALIEAGAGFHPDLSGRENIYLNGAILGLSRAEVTRKFDQIVEFSGLADFLDTPVKRYSTGMYARLGFSVAAHVDPDVLIVDEVLSVGDFAFQNRCNDRMREIVNRGCAIILVSHNLNAVASFCDRTILLDHGRIAAEGSPNEVIASYVDSERSASRDVRESEVFISGAVIRGGNGPNLTFQPGEDAWVDIDVTANTRCEKLSLTVYLKDERNIIIFDTSSERLGLPSFTLERGETRTLTLRLKLHLSRGSYDLGAHIYRYDIDKLYDRMFPVSKFIIVSPIDVGSGANLYPEFENNDALIPPARPNRIPQLAR